MKVLSLWYVYFCGYLCEMSTRPNITKYKFLALPAKDTWGVLMRKDCPLAQQKVIQPEDLWELPLIASKQKYVDDNISNWIKKDYSKLNIVATYNLIFNAALMVE